MLSARLSSNIFGTGRFIHTVLVCANRFDRYPIKPLDFKRPTSPPSQSEQIVIQADETEPLKSIAIPKRIKRGSTDILQALASTVKRDYTAPHYKYHDDPFFIPYSNIAKRSFALSKESGRKAAMWIKNEYPELIGKLDNTAQPSIDMFMPKVNFLKKDSLSEEDLRKCIDECWVEDAQNVYDKLKSNGVEVNAECRQDLLELLCYYNSEEAPNDDLFEERWLKSSSKGEYKKSWKDKSLADELYNGLEMKTPEVHCAYVRGLAKYHSSEQANSIFESMRQSSTPIDVDTINSMITLTPFLCDNSESRWEFLNDKLMLMKSEQIRPNLATLNACLDVLSRTGSWRMNKANMLQIIEEFRQLDIEPSLASYYYVLTLFCKERGPTCTILVDIMNHLQGKNLEIQDERDVFFFVTAMQVSHVHLQDVDLAYKVNNLLHHGDNYRLIGDGLKESVYFQHFFKLMCATETCDTFFEMYNKFVPNVYTPEPTVMMEIIKMIEWHGALQHLPRIWGDLVLFQHALRENLLTEFLRILASAKQDPELLKQFADVAWAAKNKIDSQESGMFRPQLSWSGKLLSYVLQVFINAQSFDKAWSIVQKCQKEQHKIAGFPLIDNLHNFVKDCIVRQDFQKALFTLKYINELGFSEVSDIAKDVIDGIPSISPGERHYLTSTFNVASNLEKDVLSSVE